MARFIEDRTRILLDRASQSFIKIIRHEILYKFMVSFHILTIFPNIFDSYLKESIMKRAVESEAVRFIVYDLRDWTEDKHRTVDDKPYGGGAGMVLMPLPVIRAINDIRKKCGKETRSILFAAKGRQWKQADAMRFSRNQDCKDIIMICGRYEGIDERVRKFVDEEISIGPYVLSGGELAALIVADTIARLLPGVLGNEESAIHESFSDGRSREHPQYTRPEAFEIDGKKYQVPKVLLSGNHKEIEKWKQKKAKGDKPKARAKKEKAV